MGLTIVKTDARGAYRLTANEDLYLDETRTKIIVVKDGEEVPKEAAFVLAGKGGTIPPKYAEMLKALESPIEVKDEVKEELKAESQPVAAEPEPVAKVEPAKPKPAKEKSEEKPAQ